ncbi:hypothetical protein [Rariglobus hedericola]|uniref:Uncharacterized protein n=1 Tax=Rariglobus hedericola TaxID=2597822 RepID=A0A556QEG1_9BACT|nr:hypothetical protein [Rariglobus hedericola]TSJ75040.1 hypothetical protein FPL22_16715 [Rariglobus hedericola]
MPLVSRSLLFPVLTLALTVVWPAALPAQSVKTPADWDLKISQVPKGLPVKGEAWLPDDDNYAWQAARYIEGYLALARVTGDRKYMNDSREILDYMLTNRDDIRFADKPLDAIYHYAPTTYMFHRGTPAKGWRRGSGPAPAKGVSVLIDGRICEMFIQWCELARQGFPGVYEADVKRYLDRVQETIEMHLPSFFDVIKVDPVKVTYRATRPAGGFRHWWHVNELTLPASEAPRTYSGQIPLNHSMTMARAMLGYGRLRGTDVYRDKVQLVVNFFLNSIDPAVKDRALWEYDPARKDRFDIEDVGHAAIDLSLVEAAYRAGGYGIDDALVKRLVKTFHGFYYEPTHDVYFNISGPKKPGDLPRKNYGERTAIGFASWLWLAEFDPTIAVKVRATYETYFTGGPSGFTMGGWGNLLYAESVLAGKAAIVLPKTPAIKPGGR